MRTSAPAVSVLVLGACLLAGCGEEDDAPRAGDPPTRLEVEVRPRGAEGAVRRTTYDCTQPARDPAVCERLEALPSGALEPPSPGRVCTQIYGGPATAVVTGELRGRPVEARFSLRNGCRIARWERFAWLLGDPPGIRRP